MKSQPDSIRSSLDGAVEEVESDLKYMEGCLRQSRTLWDENYGTTPDGLAHHRARHLKLLEDDEEFAAEALERASKAEQSLNVSSFLAHPIMMG